MIAIEATRMVPVVVVNAVVDIDQEVHHRMTVCLHFDYKLVLEARYYNDTVAFSF